MRRYSIKGILLIGKSIEDHEHKEILDIIIDGDTAQKVKENFLENFSLEIQEVDKNNEIIPLMDCKTLQEEMENYDCIVLNQYRDALTDILIGIRRETLSDDEIIKICEQILKSD